MSTETTSDDSPETPPPKKRGHGIKGRSGPPNNANAAKHGLRGALGRLPPGFGYVRRVTVALERQIAAEWAAKHGKMTTAGWVRVQAYIRHETAVRLAQRWLAIEADKMPSADKLSWVTRLAQFTDAAARAFDRLGLDRQSGPITADDLFADFGDPTPRHAPEDPTDAQ